MFERINKRLENFLFAFAEVLFLEVEEFGMFVCRRYSSPRDLVLALPSLSHHLVRFPPKHVDFFHRSSWLLAAHAARTSSS